MIDFLDTFIDSRDKRKYLFILIGWILICYLLTTMILCGFALIQVQNVNDLQNLLTNDLLWSNYFIRLASYLYSKQLTLGSFIQSILQAIQSLECCTILHLLIINKKCFRKKYFILIMSLLIEISLCFLLCLPLLQMQSFHVALQRIQICGYIILIISLLQMIISLKYLYQTLKQYCNSLTYRVIEEKN